MQHDCGHVMGERALTARLDRLDRTANAAMHRSRPVRLALEGRYGSRRARSSVARRPRYEAMPDASDRGLYGISGLFLIDHQVAGTDLDDES